MNFRAPAPVTSLRVVDGHFPANLSRQFSSVYVAAPTRLRPTRVPPTMKEKQRLTC